MFKTETKKNNRCLLAGHVVKRWAASLKLEMMKHCQAEEARGEGLCEYWWDKGRSINR